MLEAWGTDLRSEEEQKNKIKARAAFHYIRRDAATFLFLLFSSDIWTGYTV